MLEDDWWRGSGKIVEDDFVEKMVEDVFQRGWWRMIGGEDVGG